MDQIFEFTLIIIGVCAAFGVFTKFNIDRNRNKTKKLSKKKLRELESNGK